MNHQPVSIIYLAHGPKHLHRQSIFSILTLCHHLNFDFHNINLVVYTDDPAIFKRYLPGLPIHFELLSKEQIAGYIRNNYVHRVKICVIQDCMRKYGTDICFLDGDTYLLQSPLGMFNKIGPHCSIFHSLESTIADGGPIHEVPIWLTLRKLARNFEYTVKGRKFKLGFDSEVWNSGVLGFSKVHLHYIDDVLELNDQLTANANFKTAEQFAFAYILKQRSQLLSTEEFVYHYYLNGLKAIYNYHIHKFLNESLHESLQDKALRAVNLYTIQDQLKLPEKTVLDRLQIRIKMVWQVARYGHL